MSDNKPISVETTKAHTNDSQQNVNVKRRDANKKQHEPNRFVSYPAVSGQWYGPDYNFNDADW